MSSTIPGLVSQYEDTWLIDGIRTPFADFNGALARISPIDLGIKAAREVFRKSGVPAKDVNAVYAGSMAQASFDAYVLPRHIGLYSGVPIEAPAILVQRVCGTGMEIIMQAADGIALKRIELGLCAAGESMSRNPIVAYTHRSGFRLGQVEFKDFLWEALRDPCADVSMGDTAETLAREYSLSREDVDVFASESFKRACEAQNNGFLAGEIVPVITEKFEQAGFESRGIQISRKITEVAEDSHVRPSPVDVLTKLKPVFGGVQTGGNSSAIVDAGAAALVGSGDYVRRNNINPLAKVVAGAVVGVAPDNMGIGPVAAIRALLNKTGLSIDDIDRFEINEAFGAQCLACIRELGIDRNKVNVNGGSIAIGHPLAVTGLRLSITVSRELQRSKTRYGIASACIGGGQGIAVLLENPTF